MEKEYVLVCWTESQILMEQEWFDECILMNDENHIQEIGSSAYFVPKNRYNDFYKSALEDGMTDTVSYD